jgi:hypothetical protein
MKDRNPQVLKYGIDLSRARDTHKFWACLFGGLSVAGFLTQLLPLTLWERGLFIVLACALVGGCVYEALSWQWAAREYERNRPKNEKPGSRI